MMSDEIIDDRAVSEYITCEECNGDCDIFTSCCGDNISFSDTGLCPTCGEHCGEGDIEECAACEGTGEIAKNSVTINTKKIQELMKSGVIFYDNLKLVNGEEVRRINPITAEHAAFMKEQEDKMLYGMPSSSTKFEWVDMSKVKLTNSNPGTKITTTNNEQTTNSNTDEQLQDYSIFDK